MRDRQGRRLFAFAAIAIALATGPAHSGSVLAAEADESSPGLVGRSNLGLQTDGVLGSEFRLSAAWGAILTEQEELALNRRAEIQVELGPARTVAATYADVVAGVFLSQDSNFDVDVAVVKAAPPEVVSAITKALPAGVLARPVVVERSRSDLRAIQARVMAESARLAGGPVRISAVGIDAARGVVSVLVDGDADAGRAKLVGQFGDAVDVRAGSFTPTGCTSTSNCTPLRGGLEMLNPLHPGYYQCSTGFNARPTAASSTRYILTAGHCWQDSTDSSFQHAGSSFGTATFDTFQNTTAPHYSDALLITRGTFGAGTPMNTIYIPNDVSAYTITGLVPYANQDVDDLVCNVGVHATGARCGQITNVEYNVDIQPGGRWGSTIWFVFALIEAKFAAQPGDSGGPVYVVHQAYGTATGSSSATRTVYSAIDLMLDDIDRFSSYTPRLCLNSSCT